MQSIKSTLTIFASLLYLTAVGQIKFEEGYIVNNDEKKIDCLIENKDWLENPSSFLYKLTDSEQPKVGTVADIKEFGVYSYSKFLRATVQLDTSNSFVMANYSRTRKPQWSTKTLFLKKIVTGSANLYRYQYAEILAFFYSTSKDSTIRQLIYKGYYTQDGKVGENIDFKQQLINEISCGEILKNIGNISYQEPVLKKLFTKYNSCKGDVIQPTPTPTKNTTNQATRRMLNLKVTPGISYSMASLHDDRDYFPGPQVHLSFEKKLTFRAGLEAEFILPFNKNKWGIIFEPNFQSYEATTSGATIKYQSIEFPIGLRYYCFLKKEGSIFFNVMLLPGTFIDLTDSQIVIGGSKNIIETKPGCSVGVGYAKGPFSLETRYYLPQNLVYNEARFHAPYQRLALIVGYRFLAISKKIKE